jgi:hypothetical protein
LNPVLVVLVRRLVFFVSFHFLLIMGEDDGDLGEEEEEGLGQESTT